MVGSHLPVPPDVFVAEGEKIINESRMSRSVAVRRFRGLFGATPTVCARLWALMINFVPECGMPKHLLWALMFLKIYANEHVLSTLAGADEKTYRKWVWIFIQMISGMNAIDWERRRQFKMLSGCWVSVDGTDFRIQEPSPFSPKWFSFKFKGAGLRYEVALQLQSGEIMWVHGPFPCGKWPDLKIFRSGLKQALDPGEKVIADSGYRDSSVVTPPDGEDPNRKLYADLRARHETVNKRFKQFAVLSNRFRHEKSKQANITQLSMVEDPIFSVLF